MEWFEEWPEMGEYEYYGSQPIDETHYVRGAREHHNYCMYTGSCDPPQLPRDEERYDPRPGPLGRRIGDALRRAAEEITERFFD